MKTLTKANANLSRLGFQRAEPGRHYKENPFLIKDGAAWYNPLTGEAVLVEGSAGDMQELVRRWYYVPEDFDVMSAVHLVRQKTLEATRVMGRPAVGSYTIFTTTACNAACTYCFEKDMKPLTMSDATALDVAKFIARTRRRNTAPSIKWFGGEPLVNQQAIRIICGYLRDNGIPFRSDFSSNGDLFDRIPDKTLLEDWQMREVQLTFDDTGDGYAKYKGLDAGAYDRLKKTIIRLTGLGIHVVARIHYHPEDGPEPFRRVVDDLKNISGLGMYGRIIYKTESKEHYRELLELEDYMAAAEKYQFGFPRRGGGTHCMADNPRALCITPEGKLSPCEHYAYGEVYGSIYSGTMDREMLAEWKAREKHMCDCKTCPLYPSCEKIMACPAEGSCEKGYQYYQIETIRRAMRQRAAAAGAQTVANGSAKRVNAVGFMAAQGKSAGQAATVEDLRAQCGVC